MFTPDHLAAYLPALEKAGHIYVGYSGGLDSHVLLHSVAALVGCDKVTALHVNHQLSPNANSWQSHCAEQCRQLRVGFEAFRVSVEADGNGLENAARDARYRIYSAALQKGDLLLLGHHADDQAETVLYRLLRSSGPKGLAGIPRQRLLGEGELLRPLLDFTRSDLKSYAEQQELDWIEDESNQQTDFDRNFLRHRVMPVLEERWPDLAKRLSVTADLCRQNDQFNEEIARDDLVACEERKERLGVSLQLGYIETLSQFRRQNLIRYWLQQHGYSVPPSARLERIHRELIEAKEDASPLIQFGDCELRRYQQRVYLLPVKPEYQIPELPMRWDGKASIAIANIGLLTGNNSLPSGEMLSIRFRQGGERITPVGESHSRSVKKLLNERCLEPWLRDSVPFVYAGEQLIAIAGLVSGVDGFECQFKWQLSG